MTSEFQCINLHLKIVSMSLIPAWKLALEEACHEMLCFGVHLDPGLVWVGDLWWWTHPSRAHLSRSACGWSSGVLRSMMVLFLLMLFYRRHFVRAEGIFSRALYLKDYETCQGGRVGYILWWKKLYNMSLIELHVKVVEVVSSWVHTSCAVGWFLYVSSIFKEYTMAKVQCGYKLI